MGDNIHISMVIGAIDPGLDGAAAVISQFDRGVVESCLLPLCTGVRGREIDTRALARWLEERDVTDCVVEMAQVMPGEASSRAFKYGMGYGSILGLLRSMDIKHFPVHPLKWKRHHGLIKRDKISSRERAIEFWPMCMDQFALVKDTHRAEAALMAAWFIGRVN